MDEEIETRVKVKVKGRARSKQSPDKAPTTKICRVQGVESSVWSTTHKAHCPFWGPLWVLAKSASVDGGRSIHQSTPYAPQLRPSASYSSALPGLLVRLFSRFRIPSSEPLVMSNSQTPTVLTPWRVHQSSSRHYSVCRQRLTRISLLVQYWEAVLDWNNSVNCWILLNRINLSSSYPALCIITTSIISPSFECRSIILSPSLRCFYK